MAEIQIKSANGRSPKLAPRIDLTPMVDLGFLLITFFMFTTTMSHPKAMELQMPYVGPHQTHTAYYETSAITLMPAGNNKVYYYEGLANPLPQFKLANTTEALRNVLIQKQKSIQKKTNPEERKLQVVIKPSINATLNNIVGVLDEMHILDIQQYAMVDMTKEEAGRINMK